MMRDFTVFIIDDDHAARESVCAVVTSAGFMGRPYASARSFIEHYDGQSAGCVVTDYRMSDIDGLELQEHISARQWGLPVIMLSGYADVSTTVHAMQNGAITLLEKPYDQDVLIDAITLGSKRYAHWHERRGVTNSIQSRVKKLTPGEAQVLALLLTGHSNKQIAHQLAIGLRTVERRRHRILRKMHVKTIAEVARLLTIVEQRTEPTTL